jgi:hypothetical protein
MKYTKQAKNAVTMLAALWLTCIVSSCEKAENLYSNYRAYFRYNPVSAKPNLHRACTSLGEFCSITYPVGANKYVIDSPSSSVDDYITPTALEGYHNFRLGVGGGLIVGLPVIPNMMEAESKIVCYDLCCSNCHINNSTYKHLTLGVAGTANCPSCQRNYDLNNQGFITEGAPGRSLYRYYVSYYPPSQTLTINNN